MLVPSPDSYALRAKDSLEQLPQILSQTFFPLKKDNDENAWLTMDIGHMKLGQEFKGTVPDHLSPIGCWWSGNEANINP